MGGELVAFIILSAGLLGSAAGVLIARNPIYSALGLIMSFFFLAGLYLQLNATFIAIIQILVYGGAIMVLFLFVIMLLNLSDDELGERRTNLFKVVSGLSVLLIVGMLFSTIAGAQKSYFSKPQVMRTAVMERLDEAGQRRFPQARIVVGIADRLSAIAVQPSLTPADQSEAADLFAMLSRITVEQSAEVSTESSSVEDDGESSAIGVRGELSRAAWKGLDNVVAKAGPAGTTLTRNDIAQAVQVLYEDVLSESTHASLQAEIAAQREHHQAFSGLSEAERGAALQEAKSSVEALVTQVRERSALQLEALLGEWNAETYELAMRVLGAEAGFWHGVAFYRDWIALSTWGKLGLQAEAKHDAAGEEACQAATRLMAREVSEAARGMTNPAFAGMVQSLQPGADGAIAWAKVANEAARLRESLPGLSEQVAMIDRLQAMAAQDSLEPAQVEEAGALVGQFKSELERGLRTREAERLQALLSRFQCSPRQPGDSVSCQASAEALVRADVDEVLSLLSYGGSGAASTITAIEEVRTAIFEDEKGAPETNLQLRSELIQTLSRGTATLRRLSAGRTAERIAAFGETALSLEDVRLAAAALSGKRAELSARQLGANDIEVLHGIASRIAPAKSLALRELEPPSMTLERIADEVGVYGNCGGLTPAGREQIARVAGARLRGYDDQLTALAAIVESERGPAAWRGHGAERLVALEMTREERTALSGVDARYGEKLEALLTATSAKVLDARAAEALQQSVEAELSERGNPATRVQKALLYRERLEAETMSVTRNASQQSAAEAALASLDPQMDEVLREYKSVASVALANLRERGPSAEHLRYRPAVYDEDDFGTVKAVGRDLFTVYLLPFEVTSVLLLAAILGAAVIARRRV